ncbi:MAG: hypothetical protein ACR2GG_02310, partial [Gemmatimonadaceae bacterium]
PGVGEDGRRDFRRLVSLLEQPLAVAGVGPEKRPVYHLVIAAKKDPETGELVDRLLTDGEWRDVAETYLDRMGLAPRRDDLGVRWVAVRHATTTSTSWPLWPGRTGGGCYPATTSTEPAKPAGRWRPDTG